MKMIYFMDDQYASLADLQIAVPEAWILPGIGEYMDSEGSVSSAPVFGEEIVIRRLSELLIDKVDGYQ